MRIDSSPEDLRTRLLEIAHTRELNAETMARVVQQLLEIRAVIRHNLETPWPEGQDSTAKRRELMRGLGALFQQDLSAQEELGSQFGAGIAITERMRSVVKDMRNEGVDVSDVLSRIDQILLHEAWRRHQ
jgi:hypothetical protein